MSERTQRHQRAQIREHRGFRVFRAEDEPALVAWLSERVTSPNPDAESLKIAAYGHLRSQLLEPPVVRQNVIRQNSGRTHSSWLWADTHGTDAAIMLFHVVNDRHGKKRVMIFTTNKPHRRRRDDYEDRWRERRTHGREGPIAPICQVFQGDDRSA